ncbi:MAG: diguanylate cyclase [Spirochaetaceae bacterium]|nr:MAG: diguanylate cyclase [Spirochaetaceae bacterium]
MSPARTHFLKSVAIFSDLTDSECEHVVPLLQSVTLARGEQLFSEGDPGETLYVVEHGECTISVRLQDGQQIDIVTFSAGDFFGEMSIFEDAPRSATCTARSVASLYALTERDFTRLFTEHPELSMKVMFRMLTATARRLRDTNVFLSDMVQWGDAARRRAVTDEATGLFNRRFLDEAIEEQFQKARSEQTPISVVMLDLDHFNGINEAYGMAVGDEVIQAVVPVFRACFRETDIVSRYGGDEFTILLPGTDVEDAHRICSDVCRRVAELDILANRGGAITQVTTSQGIAAFPRHGQTVHDVRERADQALYRAKEMGRNRAEIAHEPE